MAIHRKVGPSGSSSTLSARTILKCKELSCRLSRAARGYLSEVRSCGSKVLLILEVLIWKSLAGFKGLKPALTIVRKPPEPSHHADEYLPSVMTCQNYVSLFPSVGSSVPPPLDTPIEKKRYAGQTTRIFIRTGDADKAGDGSEGRSGKFPFELKEKKQSEYPERSRRILCMAIHLPILSRKQSSVVDSPTMCKLQDLKHMVPARRRVTVYIASQLRTYVAGVRRTRELLHG